MAVSYLDKLLLVPMQEEPPHTAVPDTQAEVQLPSAVESVAKERSVKSASPDDVSMSLEKARMGQKVIAREQVNGDEDDISRQDKENEEAAPSQGQLIAESAEDDAEADLVKPFSTDDVAADPEV